MYISQDPIRLGGGFTLYSYVNNCNNWIDPLGLKGCTLEEADEDEDYDYVLTISRETYPETAGHIQDAIDAGHPDIVTVDRRNATENRKESLAGIPTVPGKDRDEWPMAMFREGGAGADIAHIDPKDNRGAGSSIGSTLRNGGVDEGDRVKIVVVD